MKFPICTQKFDAFTIPYDLVKIHPIGMSDEEVKNFIKRFEKTKRKEKILKIIQRWK